MIKRISLALGFALLATLTTACADDFDPPSWVNKLRILAVAADTPFARPGQEVHLDALAYDPEQRALSWGWGTCEAVASSDAIDCLRQTSFAQLTIGRDLTTHTLRMPDTEASYVGVVVVACPGTLRAGITSTMPVACIDDNGSALTLAEFELGLKRIFVRDSNQNQNPQIQGLTLDGVDWTADALPMARCTQTKANACTEFAKQKIELRVDGASEDSVDSEGHPIREQAVVQFYATGGEFEDDVRLASSTGNEWHAKPADAGKRVTFWFVVRDDRAGVSWITRTLQVP